MAAQDRLGLMRILNLLYLRILNFPKTQTEHFEKIKYTRHVARRAFGKLCLLYQPAYVCL